MSLLFLRGRFVKCCEGLKTGCNTCRRDTQGTFNGLVFGADDG